MKQLGILTIYETIRNWIKIYKLNIKQKKYEKEITIVDPKESYIIIFNDLKHLSFLNGAQELVPNSNFKLISSEEIDKKENIVKLPKINSCTKIIVAVHKLNSKYIKKLLGYLIKNKQHKTKSSPHNMHFMCIRSINKTRSKI